ncbi:MAG: transposase, partial [Candidatus Thorarchaeota archaeon]|nr:transposase [Candidatus Thorarchaeota archaeon]
LQTTGYSSRKIPRYAFTQRFDIVYSPELEIRHWLKIRDSLDSKSNGSKRHDKLMVPLSISSFHLNRMQEGEVKTVRIFKDSRRKWWAIFTVTLAIESIDSAGKPPAVLSIDLGINKAACSVLLTRKGYRQIRYWKQEDKLRRMQSLDERVTSLQQEKEHLITNGENPDRVTVQLRSLSGKRERVSKEFDKKLIRDISDYITEISRKYNIFVSIGQLKGIRNTARKGNYRGRRFRGMIHRWAFARIRETLGHKLAALGLDPKKYHAVPEQWTSIMCYKCGHKGQRPKQNLFICTTCGLKTNADLNGALNIGKRLIMLIPSLRDENGLGMWLTSKDRAILKARRKTRSSHGKSALPPETTSLKRGVRG